MLIGVPSLLAWCCVGINVIWYGTYVCVLCCMLCCMLFDVVCFLSVFLSFSDVLNLFYVYFFTVCVVRLGSFVPKSYR